MSLIDKLKTYPKQYDLSDLHIRSNQPLAIREGGEIKVFNDDVITKEQIESFWKSTLDKTQFDSSNSIILDSESPYQPTYISQYLKWSYFIGYITSPNSVHSHR